MPLIVGGTVRISIRPLGGLAFLCTGVVARAGADVGCFCTTMARGLAVVPADGTVDADADGCTLRFFLVG